MRPAWCLVAEVANTSLLSPRGDFKLLTEMRSCCHSVSLRLSCLSSVILALPKGQWSPSNTPAVNHMKTSTTTPHTLTSSPHPHPIPQPPSPQGSKLSCYHFLDIDSDHKQNKAHLIDLQLHLTRVGRGVLLRLFEGCRRQVLLFFFFI